MKAIIAAAAMSVLGTTQVSAESIEIRRNGQTPSVVGKADNFSGHAVVSPLLPPNESTCANLGQVDFAPGARTAWHTHPAGQLLIVTAGKGWVQEEGKARQDIAPGDVVWIPAAVRHWHGATATSPMSHLAMTYMVDGKNVDWQEPVSDEQYQ
ncbi:MULTISPECIES: (R)-mandelonitrile lyase [Klebsiella]|uniref:Cupin domain-containing protein n=1 Tax=Klebsiella michiganensis TaxID=1134687 RepID=A0AB35PP95_9ENTR|nr:cupin domain-containing protein [Klebsiella michiganensis]AID92163.1 TetR family transcriptional regulator [Klebsiella oxytoca KONIH1]APM31512.1 TetR family transcriptional regulator [Klebsiella oxytoca]MDU1357414.1 cupin domain-containing protein [Citrobacter freundii]AIE67025.1 TetR family transcriptional regulator [Klebsiella michiganensis]AUV90424.1 cupin domain-containing protein [Klebsiella oxytoca]